MPDSSGQASELPAVLTAREHFYVVEPVSALPLCRVILWYARFARAVPEGPTHGTGSILAVPTPLSSVLEDDDDGQSSKSCLIRLLTEVLRVQSHNRRTATTSKRRPTTRPHPIQVYGNAAQRKLFIQCSAPPYEI